MILLYHNILVSNMEPIEISSSLINPWRGDFSERGDYSSDIISYLYYVDIDEHLRVWVKWCKNHQQQTSRWFTTLPVTAVSDIVWKPSTDFLCLPPVFIIMLLSTWWARPLPGFLINGAPPVCSEESCVEIWLQLQKRHKFSLLLSPQWDPAWTSVEFHLISAGFAGSDIPQLTV